MSNPATKMYNPFEPTVYQQAADRKRRRIDRAVLNARPCNGGGITNIGSMSADEIVRQRLASSAQLGIGRAVQQIGEIEAAESRAKLVAGEDKRSRMKNLLSTLQVAVTGTSEGIGQLEFQATAAGNKVVVTKEQQGKPPLTGKPSSCILIRNLLPGSGEQGLIADVAVECSRFGLVKDVQLHIRNEASEEERNRIFVRFDTVATAFKAAEGLNGQVSGGRMLIVCFTTPSVMDGLPNEPQQWEVPVARYL